MIWGAIDAAIQSPKFQPIAKEHTEALTKIQMEAETGVIDEKTRKKEAAKTIGNTVVGFVKTFGRPIAEVGCGAAVTSWAFVETDHRWTGSAAALSMATVGWNQYRQNIIKKYGEEADIQAMYSVQEEKVKGKKGEEPTIKYSIPNCDIPSEWAVFIDRNDENTEKDTGYLLAQWTSVQQAVARKLLTSIDHTVSMADIFSLLKIVPKNEEVKKAIRVMGYKYDPEKDELDENGLPKVFQILAVTVWPNAEKVPVVGLHNEYAECLRLQADFSRLDEEGVWIDFPKPQMII